MHSPTHGESPLASLLRLISEHHRITLALSTQAALLAPMMSPEDCERAADAIDDTAAVDKAYVILQGKANEAYAAHSGS